ncbi:hypothetical protein Tco_0321335 [Tanacetum coccineum]
MELVLEQTQQGSSHKVSVSTEGVEELKRNVRIKGEKKEALHIPRQKPDSILQARNPVKEIPLKLNLPDHRSILTDSKVHIKMVMEIPGSSCWFKKSQVHNRMLIHNLHNQRHHESSSICVKEMKEIFEELDAEVDQHAVNRKYDEIE